MQDKEGTSVTTAKELNITVSYDNNPYKEKLTTAWGFYCIIKRVEKTIL
ncbi:MAG: hypothetical protein U9N03_04335 [Candidatus Caldatribacteriota bacterium]|nr:hypothetical protein [Candidatus Caldatribacteriota bacterium]